MSRAEVFTVAELRARCVRTAIHVEALHVLESIGELDVKQAVGPELGARRGNSSEGLLALLPLEQALVALEPQATRDDRLVDRRGHRHRVVDVNLAVGRLELELRDVELAWLVARRVRVGIADRRSEHGVRRERRDVDLTEIDPVTDHHLLRFILEQRLQLGVAVAERAVGARQVERAIDLRPVGALAPHLVLRVGQIERDREVDLAGHRQAQLALERQALARQIIAHEIEFNATLAELR